MYCFLAMAKRVQTNVLVMVNRFLLQRMYSPPTSQLRVLDMIDPGSLARSVAVNRICIVGVVVVLQCLCARRLGERVQKTAADDVALEQLTNGLERHALGLGHTEDSPDTHDNAERAKQQECAVCYMGEHKRRQLPIFSHVLYPSTSITDLCDHEIEQPLRHERGCHDQRTNMIRGAL